MMLVRCYVAPSPIEGLGVFAGAKIEIGDLVCRFEPNFDKQFSRNYLSTLPKQNRDFVRHYAVAHPEDPNMLLLDTDEGRFMNHSSKPNVDFSKPYVGIALEEIEPGVELTADYMHFKARPTKKRKSRQAGPFHRMPGLETREINNRIYVADKTAGGMISLGELSSAIWRLTSEPVSIEESISVFEAAFPDLNKEDLRKEIIRSFDHLLEIGIITDSPPES